MSCKKDDGQKFEKIKHLKCKDICVTNLKAKNADIVIADIESAVIDNAEIKTLDTDKILLNGVDISCSIRQPAVSTSSNVFIDIGVTGVTGPENVDPDVFVALVENAEKNRKELQCRIYDGRCFINDYLQAEGCPESCPPPEAGSGPTACFTYFTGSISGTTMNVVSINSGDLQIGQVVLGPGVLDETGILSQISGETGSVGTYEVTKSQNIPETQLKATQPATSTCKLKPILLKTFGAITTPIYNRNFCISGATGDGKSQFFDNINTSIGFNLQCTYLLEVAKSINPRVVSVLVQIGFYDARTSSIIIDEIFIANRQFGPTLDTLYGENYANNISIPSNILSEAYVNSQDPVKQGAIQMVVFEEEGICIWSPKGNGFECRGQDTKSVNNLGNQQYQAQIQCPVGEKVCQGVAVIYGGSIPSRKFCGDGTNGNTAPFCVPCDQKCTDVDDDTLCDGPCNEEETDVDDDDFEPDPEI